MLNAAHNKKYLWFRDQNPTKEDSDVILIDFSCMYQLLEALHFYM